jgi:hypothetical protein
MLDLTDADAGREKELRCRGRGTPLVRPQIRRGGWPVEATSPGKGGDRRRQSVVAAGEREGERGDAAGPERRTRDGGVNGSR